MGGRTLSLAQGPRHAWSASLDVVLTNCFCGTGKVWIRQMLLSAFLMPSVVCGMAFFINFIAIYYHASRAIPFGTMVSCWTVQSLELLYCFSVCLSLSLSLTHSVSTSANVLYCSRLLLYGDFGFVCCCSLLLLFFWSRLRLLTIPANHFSPKSTVLPICLYCLLLLFVLFLIIKSILPLNEQVRVMPVLTFWCNIWSWCCHCWTYNFFLFTQMKIKWTAIERFCVSFNGSCGILMLCVQVAVTCICIFVILPLNLVGTVMGRNLAGTPNYPCRINAVPRPIPEKKW